MEKYNHSKMIESQKTNEGRPARLICGFWRRLFAFFIDSIILGIFGLIIGTVFFDFFAEIGSEGLIFGFTVALLYFGIQNSVLCGGQTIGKRVLKIKVVNKEAETIPVQRSFVRFMILGPPYFLNGALLPPNLQNNFFVSLLIGVIVFFGLGGIIYLYLFNRNTRQSLHDLVVGTYVVNAPTSAEYRFQPIWKGHLAILSLMFIGTVVVLATVVPKLSQKDFFKELLLVQDQIQSSGLVHAATVSAGKSFGISAESGENEKWETKYFSINVVLKKKPSNYDIPIHKIAKIVLDNYPKMAGKDSLAIKVIYGYDIGIARGWNSRVQQHSPKEWKELLTRLSEKREI